MTPSREAREAAARWAKSNSRHAQAANILRGSCDMAPLVQAFATFEQTIRADERRKTLDAILSVRAANAAAFGRTGAVWEAYDRAVLDCHEAISALTPKEGDHVTGGQDNG